jgi:PEP-CTERM motif
MRLMGILMVGSVIVLAAPVKVSAVTIQTLGSGSAVTTVDGTANFESIDALFDNPYSEGGMLFSRTGLTFDNNGCGYAGCGGAIGLVGFSGNYMYGYGMGGYFELVADKGSVFNGLEFTIGTGFINNTLPFAWEAYDAGANLVGSGSGDEAAGTVIGFLDPVGFARLRYTSTSPGDTPDFTSSINAPAFDTVKADFSVAAPVPEPTSLSFIGLGLVGLWRAKRRARG